MPRLTPEEIQKRKDDRKKEEFWQTLKRILVMAFFASIRNQNKRR